MKRPQSFLLSSNVKIAHGMQTREDIFMIQSKLLDDGMGSLIFSHYDSIFLCR